jgi:flagellar basal-body rod protein FlgB
MTRGDPQGVGQPDAHGGRTSNPNVLMSLLDTTQVALESAMSGSMLRQTLLTNNLTNADTPGYKPEDVNFQSTLNQAIESGQPISSVAFTPFTESVTTNSKGNGVSADQQSALLAENGLLYQELTQVAAAREGILKTAIGSV